MTSYDHLITGVSITILKFHMYTDIAEMIFNKCKNIKHLGYS